jgi:putative restriction endonuclease
MNKPGIWLEEVTEALKALGGHATLDEIYEEIQERGRVEFTATWDATVRRTIESHSMDSSAFRGKHRFYSVDGKGKGHWGLVDFKPTYEVVDLTEDPSGFPEGRRALRQHVIRERNPRVIRLAKERFKAKHGRVVCQACGFDFEEHYGQLGEDYIEGHHTIPVSELIEGQETRVEDIGMVCANCHRMLHRRRPWLRLDELKKVLQLDKGNRTP